MKREILLVDDDSTLNFLTTRLIQHKHGNQPIKTFSNGLLAINYIRENLYNDYLIFLDINMPVMNGWEFLEAFEKKEGCTTDIVIFTSSIDESDKEKAASYDDISLYLTKPLTIHDFDEHADVFKIGERKLVD